MAQMGVLGQPLVREKREKKARGYRPTNLKFFLKLIHHIKLKKKNLTAFGSIKDIFV
jgi:hypothetical protein